MIPASLRGEPATPPSSKASVFLEVILEFLQKTSRGWFNVSLKVTPAISEDELKVLKSVFEIQGKNGSLAGQAANPLSWGYASRKDICVGMGDEPTECNLRLASVVLRELQAHNYLKIHRVARDGYWKAANHVLLLCLSFVAAVFESPIYNIKSDHIVGVCGLTLKSLTEKPVGSLKERAAKLGLSDWENAKRTA